MADAGGKSEAEAGPWFDLPEPAYAQRAAALSNKPDITAAAADFREKGYLVRDFGFSESDLAEAAGYTRAITTGRIQDAWLVNASIRNLATHPRVIEFLSELYQADAFPFQTLNFPRGSQQEAHSDTFHFNSLPSGFMCGVWIALEDIHPNSGPLMYYPGSQKLPIFSSSDLDLGGADVHKGYPKFVAKTLSESGHARETALIRRGQAFIWAANLFHGGSPQIDPARTRLSQVTHYYFRGCSYFTPLASDESKVFWREPYDFASKRFVRNAGRGQTPNWRYRLSERMRIWRKRPHGG